jgi:tRNA(adenine34) deaminase
MTEKEFDIYWMKMALREAEKAALDGEVPAGCVIIDPIGEDVEDNLDVSAWRILGRAHNQTEGLIDATAHAEMLALSSAFATKGNWRLSRARLYVTKEPCPMCAGAIVLARVAKVIWGVSDPKRGGATEFGIFDNPGINHHPEILSGVLERESLALLQDFFRSRRKFSLALSAKI